VNNDNAQEEPDYDDHSHCVDEVNHDQTECLGRCPFFLWLVLFFSLSDGLDLLSLSLLAGST
jgi:hypothetical protein